MIDVPTLSAKHDPAKTEVLPLNAATSPEISSSIDSGDAGPRSQSARKTFNKYAAGFLGICFVIGAVQSLTSESGKNQSDQAGSSARPRAKSQAERVESITQQIVTTSLSSPSTATFTEFRVIDQSGAFFQTYIGVDSQNGFGARVRSYFVCAFKLHHSQNDGCN